MPVTGVVDNLATRERPAVVATNHILTPSDPRHRNEDVHQGRVARLLALATVLVAATSCEIKTAGYCCSTQEACDRDEGGGMITACDDPGAPFCDNDGEFGVGRDCIPTPPGRCMTVDDCSAELPDCLDTACVECASSATCPQAEPFCNPASHACERCADDDACAAAADTPRCNLVTGDCVACLDDDDCSADAPVCGDGACRGCRFGSDCASEICDEGTGICADAAAAIYVASNGSGSGMCTQAAPCNTIALGLAQVNAARNVIRVRPGTYTGQVTLSGITVTIIGDGATIQPGNTSVDALAVSNGADVTIAGLTITGAAGAGTPVGVRCGGGAPSTLRMRRSLVVENKSGVTISGCEFSLVNNVIALNVSASSLTAGVYLEQITEPGLHELAFNTITGNAGAADTITGVHCYLIGTPLTFSNNIVYGNQVSGTGTQVGGDADCAWTYSDIGPQTVAGTGNINLDPMLVNAANRNFHLQPTSPARDAADPAATLGFDLDSDPRPQGSAPDIGADEVVR